MALHSHPSAQLPPEWLWRRKLADPSLLPSQHREELVGLGGECSCPPHVEVLLHPASIHPCPPCLGWSRGLCLEA